MYSLTITDNEQSYGSFSEDFRIGIFRTEEKAIQTALYYLANVKGFCDFNCDYHVEKIRTIDITDDKIPNKIWNINENFDEIDIIESPYMLTEERAKMECQAMKKSINEPNGLLVIIVLMNLIGMKDF